MEMEGSSLVSVVKDGVAEAGGNDGAGITEGLNLNTSQHDSHPWTQTLSNITNTSQLDIGNSTANPFDVGNSELIENSNSSEIVYSRYNDTSSENSTFSLILQTLKDSVLSSVDQGGMLSGEVTSEEGEVAVTTSDPPLPQGFTPMQKWFLATGVLLIAVIVLMLINCILKCKDNFIKELEQQKHERRVAREMDRDTDPTQTHMFMHPFFGKN